MLDIRTVASKNRTLYGLLDKYIVQLNTAHL
jgi:hypothetical protein